MNETSKVSANKKGNSISYLFNYDCFSPGFKRFLETYIESNPSHPIQLIVADIPYDMTQNEWDGKFDLAKMWESFLPILDDHGTFILFSKQPFASELICSQRKLFRYELIFREELIWEKEKATCFFNKEKRHLPIHENILVFTKQKSFVYTPQMRPGFTPYKRSRKKEDQSSNYGKDTKAEMVSESTGDRCPISILTYARDHANQGIHPTQKPKDLLAHLIRSFSNPGDTVLDFCMGSGTTAVAALETDRNVIGTEKDPAIYALAKKRINHFVEYGIDEFWKLEPKSKK